MLQNFVLRLSNYDLVVGLRYLGDCRNMQKTVKNKRWIIIRNITQGKTNVLNLHTYIIPYFDHCHCTKFYRKIIGITCYVMKDSSIRYHKESLRINGVPRVDEAISYALKKLWMMCSDSRLIISFIYMSTVHNNVFKLSTKLALFFF